MHLTIILAVVVIAVLVVAAYYYTTSKVSIPGPSPGGTGVAGSADAAAITALDQELNSATQNISASDIENSIASQ